MSLTKLLSVVENEILLNSSPQDMSPLSGNDSSDSESDAGSTPPLSPASVVSDASSTGSSRGKMSKTDRQLARSVAHLASEKKRRANINGGFEQLRSVIPGCQPCRSKADILRKAVEHIRQLSSQKETMVPMVVNSPARAFSAAMLSSPSQPAPSSTTPPPEDERDPRRKLTFALKYIECLTRQKEELQAQLDKMKRTYCMPTAPELVPLYPAGTTPGYTVFPMVGSNGFGSMTTNFPPNGAPGMSQPPLAVRKKKPHSTPSSAIPASTDSRELLKPSKKPLKASA